MRQYNFRRFEGKAAIVTGAGQWIGKEIALRLAAEGADVLVNDLVLERANEVAAEVRAMGRKAVVSSADVTKRAEVEAMVKAALDEFGKIDVLVNNVGGSGDKGLPTFTKSTEEHFDSVVARNLKSTANCCRVVAPLMMERKSGKIVNISSGSGVRGMPGFVAYSASKAGVIGLTMSLSQEVAMTGVRVNCVAPGPIGSATPLAPEFKEKMAKLSGMGTEGNPAEVAAVVALLASDDANNINGQTWAMGGMNP
jgi:3-oxoacyl-[acyl-carrier protein] reductase